MLSVTQTLPESRNELLGIIMETLINCLCGMKRKAHGAQKPRHINRIVEVAIDTPNGYGLYPLGVSCRATWQFGDSPAHAINQGFLSSLSVKNGELTATNEELSVLIHRLETQNEQLASKLHWFEEQIHLLRHKRFVKSSERTVPEQRSLFNEAEVIEEHEPAEEAELHPNKD